MRGVIRARPSMALARYHLLSSIRKANAPFVVAFLCALLPLLLRIVFLEQESMLATWGPQELMRDAAQTAAVVYIVHFAVMLLISALITSPRRQGDAREVADLMETAPITPAGRFLGDMLGALACTLVIHLCTLPLLALAIALSPISSSLFWWWELILLALLILASAGAAWKRLMSGPWGRARTAGGVALFGTLIFVVFALTTRWEDFRDAAFIYFAEPSPLRWSQLSREVMSPALLAMLLVILYTGFMAWFAMQSIRFLERREQ